MNVAAPNAPFKAQGRISRITFCAWNISLIIVLMFILTTILKFILNLSGNPLETTMFQNNIGQLILIFLIIYIPFMYFSIIFGIKRLHDLNQSGWLYLLSLVPIVNIVFALYMSFAPGTTGPNKFGEQCAPKKWESVVTWVIVGLLSLGVVIAIFTSVFMQ